MKVVVTGCAGFVGSHLTERLLSEGMDVSGIDCFIDYYPRELKEKNLETGRTRRRIDIWPLFNRREELNGNTRTQLLAPIESVLPANRDIELEYAHFWSLWLSQRNARTGASSHSLLWNLYRREVRADSRQTSFLFGLFQQRRDARGTETRIAFIPFRSAKKAPAFSVSTPATEGTRE